MKGEKRVRGKAKGSRREMDDGTCAQCAPHPHSRRHSHSKRGSVPSHSQEELLPHCHSFSGGTRPKPLPPTPDAPKSSSQSNISTQQSQLGGEHPSQPSPSPPQPLLSPSGSASLPMPIPPPPSSASASPPAVLSPGPGSGAPATASAKLQYQRLRSVPQPRRFYSPHLPLKAKSLCSRRGSAHFSSLESEV